jgi:hypothetical protein
MGAFTGVSVDLAGAFFAFNRSHGAIPLGDKIMLIVIHCGIFGEIYFRWRSRYWGRRGLSSERVFWTYSST